MSQDDSKRYRIMHKFWLDIRKEYEDWIDETIHALKQERTYTQTVRDGIRLIVDLRHKRLDALFELFPWVNDYIQERINAALEDHRRQQDLHTEIAELRGMVETMQRLQSTQPPAASATTTTDEDAPPPRPRAHKSATEDEDDSKLLVITKAKSDGGQSAKNFLASMMNLQASQPAPVAVETGARLVGR